VCQRQEGSTLDRDGNEDGAPLGECLPCEVCKRMACPECLSGADCCFVDAVNHEGDPNWAPDGWEVAKIGEHGEVQYRRKYPCGG
jgi:hypothetical protein